MESIFQLGILLRVVDLVSGPISAISRNLDALQSRAEKLQPVFDKFKDYGRWIAGAGIAGALGLGVAVTQFANLEEAQIGLKTLVMDVSGRVGAEYGKLNRLAEQLGTSLPGSTKDMVEMFTALREQGVQTNVILGGVGEASAKFAVLMKIPYAQGATMVAKFTEALGIADRESVQFMDTLQRLKGAAGVNTTDMYESLKYMGSTLKMLRVQGLEAGRDVSAAIGMMATSSIEGSQAGTNFAMAMSRFAEIDSRLGHGRIAKEIAPLLAAKGIKLNLFDAGGNFVGIRGMMAELEKLRALNPQQQLEVLSKLFGQEAARPLSVFIDKGVKGFDDMLLRMQQQADMQTKIDTIMSGSKMQWDTLTGTVANLVASIGAVVSRVAGLTGVMTVLNTVAGKLNDWILAHPTTAGVIAGIAVGVTVLALAVGGLLLAIGIGGTLWLKMSMGLGLLVQGIALVKGALAGLIPVVWSFTASLLANPITWIVLAIVAAVAVVGFVVTWMYRRVEWFRTGVDLVFFSLGLALGVYAKLWRTLFGWLLPLFNTIWTAMQKLWEALPRISQAISDALAGLLNALPALIGGLFGSMFKVGQAIIEPLVQGIKSVASRPFDTIKEIFQRIRNLLPFSDAKEGPLSQLTLSGSRIMETLGTGILGAAPGLHRTMAGALAGAALTANVAAIVPPPQLSGATAATAATTAPARGEGKRIVIQQMTVQISSVSDARDFIAQLQALVEAHDGD